MRPGSCCVIISHPCIDWRTLPLTLPHHFNVRVHQNAHERLAVEVVREVDRRHARVGALARVVRRVAAAQPWSMVDATSLFSARCEPAEQLRSTKRENERDQREEERQMPICARRPVLRER